MILLSVNDVPSAVPIYPYSVPYGGVPLKTGGALYTLYAAAVEVGVQTKMIEPGFSAISTEVVTFITLDAALSDFPSLLTPVTTYE
jgi:hypothetical protein